ncbi:hypothetical protein [Brevibacterium litoralis]|uniref:hypothetical protein n=1 Tax=Brevibacterium litoralis TaxID=3138935 RepID=UPI0032ED0477
MFENWHERITFGDPRAYMDGDLLGDAWGIVWEKQGVGNASFRQHSPAADFLYLEKAWSLLQSLTAPNADESEPRPAFRMFEGHVTHLPDWSWEPWVRAQEFVQGLVRDGRGMVHLIG